MEKKATQKSVLLPPDEALEMFVIDRTFAVATENYQRVTVYKPPIYFSSSGMKYFELEERINDFQNLEANWDSYNADPTSETSISIALAILEFLRREGILTSGIEVNVFPMRDGGIQFEFDAENLSSELEINPNGDLMFLMFDKNADLIYQKSLEIYELSELSTLLEEAEYAG